ncbi:hypothetical protein IFO70_20905 [Phormidium tenue FACHB-886]|nr:hypothetical protein [Phormidium tenue FACHB-886]
MLQFFWLGLAIALLQLAACSAVPLPQQAASKPPVVEPVELSQSLQSPSPSSVPSAAEPSAEVVNAMRADLSTTTGVPTANITLKSAEAVNWNDSCLGSARPDEICLMAVTPGYRIILSSPTKDYEFHSDRQRTFRRVD